MWFWCFEPGRHPPFWNPKQTTQRRSISAGTTNTNQANNKIRQRIRTAKKSLTSERYHMMTTTMAMVVRFRYSANFFMSSNQLRYSSCSHACICAMTNSAKVLFTPLSSR